MRMVNATQIRAGYRNRNCRLYISKTESDDQQKRPRERRWGRQPFFGASVTRDIGNTKRFTNKARTKTGC